MGIVLALVLSAPVVGVQSDGTAPCDTSGFARDLRALRPELTIVLLPGSAPVGSWRASLEGLGSNQSVLRVTGSPTPLLRPLPEGDCRRLVQTAASIVDGLLDQLPSTDVGPLASPVRVRASLSAWLEYGALLGPVSWVQSFAFGASLGFGPWEGVFLADIGLQAFNPLMTVDEGSVGSYQVLPFDFEAGGGWAPRLGPGKLSLDASVGLAVARVSDSVSPSQPLFGRQDQLTVAPFFALAQGYTLDLPARFFVGLRAEERLAPPTTVGVNGALKDRVVTRVVSVTGRVVLGFRFF